MRTRCGQVQADSDTVSLLLNMQTVTIIVCCGSTNMLPCPVATGELLLETQ